MFSSACAHSCQSSCVCVSEIAFNIQYVFCLRYLPREVDPLVYNMSHEDPGSVSYSEIGGLSEQIRELREVRKKMAKCQHQLMKYTVVQKFVIIRVFLEKKKILC